MRSGKQAQQGFTFLELVAVVIVIAILASTGAVYYGQALEASRRSGVEVLAHRFTTAVAMIHAQWIVSGAHKQVGGSVVDVDGIAVYLNEHGWPINTAGGAEGQSAASCHEVWRAVLQNPALATVEGEAGEGGHRYHISALDGRICRYELVTDPLGTHFFDYDLRTGQVLITVPPFD